MKKKYLTGLFAAVVIMGLAFSVLLLIRAGHTEKGEFYRYDAKTKMLIPADRN